MSAEGFIVNAHEGEIENIRFVCTKCNINTNMVFLQNITEQGLYSDGFTQCIHHKISPEVNYALQAHMLKIKNSQMECKTNDSKKEFNLLWLFGISPLLLGVIFPSSGLLEIGIITIVVFAVIYFYTR